MTLLDALKNKNKKSTPPVWLMRQAGRYLPEYKEIRRNHTLISMFCDPNLIAKVTLMPEKRFGVDALILFSDILMPALGMNLQLDFEAGPKVLPQITRENWQTLSWDLKRLEFVFEGVEKIKSASKAPLIGFCGAPFTVSTYLIEPEHRMHWMQEDPFNFSLFLDQLADHSIEYLNAQIQKGADVVQIFDSWSSLLDESRFEKFCLNPIEKILKHIHVPSIVFMRGSGKRAEKIAKLPVHAISIDWEVELKEIRKKVALPLQGNLDPSVLLKPIDEIQKEVRKILQGMKNDSGFIFNLGHGVLPTTPVEAIEALIEEVRRGY